MAFMAKQFSSEKEKMLACYHEAGHAAVTWYWGFNFREANINNLEDPSEYIKTHFRLWGWTDWIPDTPENRIRENERLEITICIYWGGMLAECKYTGLFSPEGGNRPDSLVLKEEQTPPSDTHLILQLLEGMGYYLQTAYGSINALILQDRAWDIITEWRTWKGIEFIANLLFQHEKLSSEAIEKIFQKYKVPQRSDSKLRT